MMKVVALPPASRMSRWRAALHDLVARRDTLIGINRRNVTLVYAFNPRRFYPEADDKLLCKELMDKKGVALARTLAICPGLFAIPETLRTLEGLEDFVVKPANSSGGDGILVVGKKLGPGRWRKAGTGEITSDEIRQRLAEIVFGAFSSDLEDRAFVEERVFPHPVFDALWPDGLCDVRVITLEAEPIFCMVRVPTQASQGKANLHQGGIGLALDLRTGVTMRAYSRGAAITVHPESGAAVVGVQMPDWPRLLDVARTSARAVQLRYLGVDIVVDKDRGPLVLEVNARPGLEIQNVHGAGMGAALPPQLQVGAGARAGLLPAGAA